MKRLVCRAFPGFALVLCSPFAVFGQAPSGDYNFNLGSPGCTPLLGVSVNVKFDKAVVSNGMGFGFQLSAWSVAPQTQPPPYIVWQQYMTGVGPAVGSNPPFINPTIQTFSAGPKGLVRELSWGYDLLNLGGPEIPAGTELTITLLNDGNDNTGNVTGATYTVTDNNGNTHTKPRHLKYIPNFQSKDLAPIVGFQFNFNGGTGNVVSVPGFSGTSVATNVPVGTIAYAALTPMTNFGTNFPPCVAASANVVTAETTNGFYSALTSQRIGASTVFSQTFGVVVPPAGSSAGGGGARTVGTTCAQLGACAPPYVPSKLDAAAEPPEAQSASSYQSNCNKIGVVGSTLTATCRRNDGSYNKTQIAIQGIENINGVLKFHGMENASTFQNSCKDIVVSAATLSATCKRTNGSFNSTSIRIPGVANINGVLRYK